MNWNNTSIAELMDYILIQKIKIEHKEIAAIKMILDNLQQKLTDYGIRRKLNDAIDDDLANKLKDELSRFGSSYYDLFDAKNLKHSTSGGDAAS